MKLRSFQTKCVERIHEEWESATSTLACLPTGGGKTVVACEVISRQSKRCIFVAHRRELLFQTKATLGQFKISCEMEMGEFRATNTVFSEKVVCAMVQTLNSKSAEGVRRLRRFDPMEFGVLIIDEAHRGVCDSYQEIIAHFKQNPALKILLLTATPDRLDEEALGQICDSVAFNYEILDAINDGWLVEPLQQFVAIEGLDFSHIKTVDGDLDGAELAEVMEMERNLQAVADATLKLSNSKRTLVFTVSVKQAEMLSNILNRHRPGCAAWVCGKHGEDKRKDLLESFESGRVPIMVNVGVLCLDASTEILTSSGWVGMRDMSYRHDVANWDNGRVFFAAPKHIVRRRRKPGEKMVILETKNRSIRVTEDHRMLHKYQGSKKWSIKHASELVGVIGELPISGVAEPLPHIMPTEPKPKLSRSRRIISNAHILRKFHSFTLEESRREAETRLDFRDGLKYTPPDQLTNDDCEFIGFWTGDGSASHLNSGGVEYQMCQWSVCRNIINKVDHLITACGFDALKKTKITSNGASVTEWHLSRGTGFGSQQRRGVFRLEPYLDKCGSALLWSLNDAQFSAFLRGYWMADGCDHKDSTIAPRCIRICGAREQLFSHIQAIACTRGYRVSLRKRKNGKHWLWYLSLTKKTTHKMTKYCLSFENGWRDEEVWCVTSDTGNIITRRNGSVTVVGNTEGYDCPAVEFIVQARLTKSRSFYAQTVGRALRPLPGILNGLTSAKARLAAIAASIKPHATVLDFVGNSGRHKLVSVANLLGGNVSDEAIEAVAEVAKAKAVPVHISAELLKEEERIQKLARERRLAEEARRARLVANATFSLRTVSPFDVFDISPVKERGWDAVKNISDKERDFFLRQHIDPEGLTQPQRTQLRKTMIQRWRLKLATIRQCAFLKRRVPNIQTRGLTMQKAGEMISKLKGQPV